MRSGAAASPEKEDPQNEDVEEAGDEDGDEAGENCPSEESDSRGRFLGARRSVLR